MALDLPYYAQTAEFSCGPACAVMALAHLDGETPTRRLEFDVWREMNMIGVRGADPWGLSVPFLSRGHPVRIVTERERTFETDRWRESFEDEEVDLGEWAMEDNRRRARERGVEAEIRMPRLDDVEQALGQDRVAICMVNMRRLHGDDIPHWVLPVAVDGETVRFHDPYPPKGRAGITWSRDEFWSIVEDVADEPIGGAPSVVVVG